MTLPFNPSTDKPSEIHVIVAMSGGVDSSVAAALLVQQGYQVTGVMMRLWSEIGAEEYNRCCKPDSIAMASQVAGILNIPFYIIDVKDKFYTQVVQPFIDSYARGLTPNPCILCNNKIRWGFLLEQALLLNAHFLATGHYARIRKDSHQKYQLLRGVDANKDQSYVLHGLNQKQLSHTLLPLGDFTKQQVRQLAHDFSLPIAERPESQDLCFLGDNSYKDFLTRNAPDVLRPGPIMSRDGKFLGEHPGLAFYTIGQRKGIRVPSPDPLYVLAKDILKNTLIVGKREELGNFELTAREVHWIEGTPPSAPFHAEVKIRYKAKEAKGWVTPFQVHHLHIRFDEPLRDITPGQYAVIYQGELCMGGGMIQP